MEYTGAEATGVRADALSVTDVNRYIKMLINSDDILSSVAVRGEISNLKKHSSGHLYFTLKDEGGEIAAVSFRADASRLAFMPRDGMRVVAFGNVDVYERSGRYQLYVRTMVADGAGAMAEAYERLKKKLTAEGLFDKERKRPLPRFPSCVGVITAPTGAAIRDIINVTGRRYPQAKLLIYPSLVQGADAPASLTQGLEILNAYGECDVIIIGRGGGSAEDLWAFNDENLVRAVAASEIPVISAVGHETDFTLCDFAADMRAPTPSAAAEIAVPDREELKARLLNASERIYGSVKNSLDRKRRLTEMYEKAVSSRSPKEKLARMGERIDFLGQRLNTAVDGKIGALRGEYAALVSGLEALSPLAVLGRGYGIVMNDRGRTVADAEQLSVGQSVSIIMRDGRATAEIKDKELRTERG